MTFDLQRILESKRTHRQRLASLPIGEKLRMLDALRERQLAIRDRTSYLRLEEDEINFNDPAKALRASKDHLWRQKRDTNTIG